MAAASLKEEFDRYAERMAVIRRLSSPRIRKTDSADTYSERLRSNFQEIGKLAAINREMLERELYPLLNGADGLGERVSEELEALADTLINVAGDEDDFENLDLPIASLIAERLLQDAGETGDLSERVRRMNEQIIVCYSMMNMVERVTTDPSLAQVYRDKGIALGEEFLALLDDREGFLAVSDMACREDVLTDARFMTSFYERSDGDPAANRRNLEILDRMLAISADPFFREAVPDFDWNYFIYRSLEYYVICTDIGNARGFDAEQLTRISKRADELEELLKSDPDCYAEFPGSASCPIGIARCRYFAGRITLETYRETLLAAYADRDAGDFGVDGACFNVLIPLELICILDPDSLSARDEVLLKDLYQGLSAYLFRNPSSGVLSFMLEYFSAIIRHFIEVPGGVTFEEFVLQCLAAIHPPTYVHSRMVGLIASRLAYHLLRTRPELFVGMPGFPSVEDVLAHREEIVSYTWHAGLCHDFGKICIIDTIFVYGRKLLDLEFDIIKSHPKMGYTLLSTHASTGRYAEVALGHHRWHDDTRGYPEDFKTGESSYRTVIDLILCADCLDAATDTVGRSYSRGKTAEEYLEELRQGAGTRYAPWLPELFEREEVLDDMKFLLTEERDRNYRETYDLLKRVQEKG